MSVVLWIFIKVHWHDVVTFQVVHQNLVVNEQRLG